MKPGEYLHGFLASELVTVFLRASWFPAQSGRRLVGFVANFLMLDDFSVRKRSPELNSRLVQAPFRSPWYQLPQ
jgi:hypothetical protein